MKRYQKSMLQGPLLPNIISYTIPLMLTGFLQLLFNATDLVVVGQFRGSASLAAVGATGSISNLVVNMFIGLAVGVSVAIAHGMGGHEDAQVHRTVHTAIPTALVSGVILAVIGVTMSEQFLIWMGTPEEILPLSSLYMRIYFCGMPFNMVYNFSASILRASGDTKSPLIYLTFAGVINVILNIVFVTVFHMNVEGVALATIIAQAISAFLVVRALMRKTDACKLDLRKIRFYKAEFLRILRLGLPAGIQGSLFSISNVLIQSSINSFGDVFMSGNAAASNIESFIYIAMNAFYQTCVNFIGQNVGARQYKRVMKIFGLCTACVAIVGLALSTLVYTFGPTLLKIYINDSAEAIQYGMIRFAFVGMPYFICGLMEVSTGALRGMGASFMPMVISVLGICAFRVGWLATIFQVPEFHTQQCLLISYPISWVLTTAAQALCFLWVYQKHTKIVFQSSDYAES